LRPRQLNRSASSLVFRGSQMRNLILVFFIVTAIFGASKTYAQCSCANAGESAFDELKSSDVVFVGKVIKVKKVEEIETVEYKNYDSTFDITIEVQTTWKTDLTQTITIRNIGSGDSDFKENETYLVYAKTYGNNLSAYIGCCTRTRLFTKASKDIEEFKVKGEKPLRILEKTSSKSTESRTNQWT
jgi:hypothetical protein